MGDIINGHNLRLKVGDLKVYAATTCDLNISGETRDLAHKDIGTGTGAGWSDAEYGTKSWESSTDCLYAEDVAGTHTDFQTLFAAFNANTKLDWEMSDDVVGNTRYSGEVVITALNLNAPNNEEATFTVSLKGSGPITIDVVPTPTP